MRLQDPLGQIVSVWKIEQERASINERRNRTTMMAEK